MIEDSFEEVMDTSAQKVNSLQNLKQNGWEKAANGFSDSLAEEEMPKIEPQTSTSRLVTDSLTLFYRGGFRKTTTELLPTSSERVPRSKNKRLSALQGSFKTQNSSKSSNGPDSFSGDFNLQLDEDSDMFSDRDIFDDEKKTEVEEREILSQLRFEGSFDVCKSLEGNHREKSGANASEN